MNWTSARGPDDLPVKFFQTFWNTIKLEIMAIFDEFFVGSIDLTHLSFRIITLIPKVSGATEISQFCPTTVINVISRILAKGTSIEVGSGASTLIWFDRWTGESPFVARFPALSSMAVVPQISVEEALTDLGRLAFCHPFVPMDTIAWQELLESIALHEPDFDRDAFL
ncbi:Signal recognition particle 54 kDa protein, chloroplastic [Hordeum vulgare]|nr:Signal recognition particle 54 kDa protein, chloroplastic [Hordeum vulgare]